MSKNTKCKCKSPKIKGEIIPGYTGLLTCGECGRKFEWPIKEVEQKGDQVEQYIADLESRHSEDYYEALVLKMLVRIEKQLVILNGGK